MDRLNRYIIGSNASIFQKIYPSSNIEVFLPTNEEEIKEAITFARERNLPITSKGGGSSLSGACTGGSRNKIVISSMKLKCVHELNFNENYAIVDPGLTPDELNAYIQKEKTNWKFFVAPSSKDIASLGGMLSTDGGGNDAWLAGTMVDNVLAVELFDYNNNKITIERAKVGKSLEKSIITCTDKKLEKQLQEKNLSIFDISNSHGVLGFIAKLKVAIKPLPPKGDLRYALVHSKSYNSFGRIIFELIENNIPLSYGEAIVEVKDP